MVKEVLVGQEVAPEIVKMVEQAEIILNNRELFGFDGQQPSFQYIAPEKRCTGVEYLLEDHWLTRHKNKKAILKRPAAVLSVTPPFTLDEYRDIVKRVRDVWSGKTGKYELKNSDCGSQPFHCMEDMREFVGGTDVWTDIYQGEVSIHVSKMYCMAAYVAETAEPIGHITLQIRISFYPDARELSVASEIPIVWVFPQYRGLAYGANLGIVAGEAMRHIYYRLGKMLPPEWEMDASVYADYDTEGGEAVVVRAYEELQLAGEMAEVMDQFRCKIGPIDLDAGY